MIRPAVILLLGFLVRVAYAVYAQLNGVDFVYENDALNFYSDIVAANRIGQFYPIEIGRSPYVNSVVLFSFLFGVSPIAVGIFSALCFTLAAYALLKTCEELNLPNSRTLMILVAFCFLPTAIVYTATPMREAMQVLGINLMLLGFVRALLRRAPGYIGLSVAGGICAGMLHGSLTMSCAVLIGMFLLVYGLFARQRISLALLTGNLMAAVALLVALFGVFSLVAYDISEGLLEAITSYQEGGLSIFARADYRTEAQGTTIAAALIALPVGLFQYLFEPLPGRSWTIVDLILVAENGLRLVLIILGIRGLIIEPEVRSRIILFFLLASYLAIELVWSVGTVNWGTAARHHIPPMGLLILCGLYYPSRIRQPTISGSRPPVRADA